VNPRSLDVLAVTTVPVRRLELTKSLRFSGILEDDENIHRVITAFYDGRIDQIYIEHVGKYAEKGQPLAAIYSPELLYVVREYQNALQGGNDSVARNAAQRLVQYGLSPEQVATLGRQPDNVFTIDLLAPISGTVLTKRALKGQYIKTGEPLFEMGNLSRLWFHAEVYERDLPDIRIGQKAILRTPTVPDREFEGVVTFIDPNFDQRTRSTKVRVEVDNPIAEGDAHGLLRVLPHRAYAEAEVTARLGEALVVPRSAVLRDSRRSVVYIETASGEHEQRQVRTGRIGDEGIEILEGVKEGERVVAQGNLMVDAERR
jgi:membrane fusion protein, copper/silver efflux system